MSLVLQKVFPDDVRRSRDIGRVVEELEGLPFDKAYRIEIEEVKSERSMKQNRYLYRCYGLMGEVSGYEKDDMHEEMCKRHFGTKLKKVPKCKDYPEGLKEVPMRTTTTNENGKRSVLGKVAFSEFVERVRRVAAFMGVNIPDPDPSLATRFDDDEDERQEQAA